MKVNTKQHKPPSTKQLKKEDMKTEEVFNTMQSDIVNRVKEYMVKNNCNKKELAIIFKVTPATVSQILKGNANFSMKRLMNIFLAIGIVPKVEYKPEYPYFKDGMVWYKYKTTNLQTIL